MGNPALRRDKVGDGIEIAHKLKAHSEWQRDEGREKREMRESVEAE